MEQERRCQLNTLEEIFNLKNKNIIIAGGAGQLGFNFCSILAELNANVILADFDIKMAKEKILKKIPKKYNKNIRVFDINVESEKSVKTFFEKIAAEYTNINGLVNCFHFKGNSRKLDVHSNFFAQFEEYPQEIWDRVHNVNLKGTFLMCKHCVKLMKNINSSIVNISSTYGIVSPNRSIYGQSGINSPVAYASSKAAIINITRYLATHLSNYKIRVNCLSPGGIFNNQSQDFVDKYSHLTPIGRLSKEYEYNGAIIFLLSNASSYMTGSNLVVDGGWTAW